MPKWGLWTLGEYLEIPMGILMGRGKFLRGQEYPVRNPEARPGGRAEFSHGKFLLDPGIFCLGRADLGHS